MNQAASAMVLEDQNIEVSSNVFFVDVLEGLSASTKSISPKYFYDDTGSQYFDEICDLEEYYPYRTELKLLPLVAEELAERFLKPTSVVEFGAGSLVKIRPLLTAMSSVCEFIPIDISGDHLFQAAQRLKKVFPRVQVHPAQGDFCHPVALNTFRGERLGFFPGSTIGNFTPDQAGAFLDSAKTTLGQKAYMLIGVDTKKSPELLHKAYNDQKGVTAKFNLNVLERMNRELNTNVDVDAFEHYAYYNPTKGRVEMHLVSKKKQTIKLGQHAITIQSGEAIHTECSYKYTPDEFQSLATKSGWCVEQTWLAEDDMFSMHLLKAN